MVLLDVLYVYGWRLLLLIAILYFSMNFKRLANKLLVLAFGALLIASVLGEFEYSYFIDIFRTYSRDDIQHGLFYAIRNMSFHYIFTALIVLSVWGLQHHHEIGKKHVNSFGNFNIATTLMLVGNFLLYFTGLITSYNLYNYRWGSMPIMFKGYILFTAVGVVVTLISTVYYLRIFGNLWRFIVSESKNLSLPEQLPSPGKAIGLLFVPFFNLYWIFKIFYGFATHANSIASANGIPARMPRSPGIIYPIIMILCGIPIADYFISMAASISALLFLGQAVNFCEYLLQEKENSIIKKLS